MTDRRQVELIIKGEIPYELATALEDVCALENVEWKFRYLPDPDRVQEFRVRIVTKATDKATVSPHRAFHVFDRLTRADFGWPFMPEAVTVTEVDPTEVER